VSFGGNAGCITGHHESTEGASAEGTESLRCSAKSPGDDHHLNFLFDSATSTLKTSRIAATDIFIPINRTETHYSSLCDVGEIIRA
jgi:hypothetical protein